MQADAVCAGISSAGISIVAIHRSEYASAGVAAVHGASIAVLTVERYELAGAISGIAHINCAEAAVVAASMDEQANTAVTYIICTKI